MLAAAMVPAMAKGEVAMAAMAAAAMAAQSMATAIADCDGDGTSLVYGEAVQASAGCHPFAGFCYSRCWVKLLHQMILL